MPPASVPGCRTLKSIVGHAGQCVEEGNLVPQHMPYIDHLRKEDNMLLKPKEDRGKWAEGLKVKDLTTEKAEVAFHAGCELSFDEEQWNVPQTALNLLLTGRGRCRHYGQR